MGNDVKGFVEDVAHSTGVDKVVHGTQDFIEDAAHETGVDQVVHKVQKEVKEAQIGPIHIKDRKLKLTSKWGYELSGDNWQTGGVIGFEDGKLTARLSASGNVTVHGKGSSISECIQDLKFKGNFKNDPLASEVLNQIKGIERTVSKYIKQLPTGVDLDQFGNHWEVTATISKGVGASAEGYMGGYGFTDNDGFYMLGGTCAIPGYPAGGLGCGVHKNGKKVKLYASMFCQVGVSCVFIVG